MQNEGNKTCHNIHGVLYFAKLEYKKEAVFDVFTYTLLRVLQTIAFLWSLQFFTEDIGRKTFCMKVGVANDGENILHVDVPSRTLQRQKKTAKKTLRRSGP